MSNPVPTSLKKEIAPLAIILVCFVASFYFNAHWPDLVASHWNFKGEVDAYSSKTFNAFFFPGLLAAMYLLFTVLPYFDPKRERYAEFSGVYLIFRTMIIAVMAIVYFTMGIFNLGYDINVGAIVAGVIGLMMIVLGNYMGKIKNNWFMGIRTPWTLSSEVVWNKTHRLGGYLFMLFGLIIIIAPYLPEMLAGILFGLSVFGVVFGTFAYSYLIYRQEKKK